MRIKIKHPKKGKNKSWRRGPVGTGMAVGTLAAYGAIGNGTERLRAGTVTALGRSRRQAESRMRFRWSASIFPLELWMKY